MGKEKWEIALDKFVSEWKNKKEVVGMVVCGSYITGNPSKHSDIDIQILLDKKVKWRERGNKIIDGILIEYFANPLQQNLKYIKDEFKTRDKTDVHMFITGKVLFDKNGDVKKIIAKAKEWNKKPFKKINRVDIEQKKYSLWDMKDNLQEIYESGSEDFHFVYYSFLSNILEKYSAFLRHDSFNTHKVLRLLVNKKDQLKYKTNKFPDSVFVKMYVDAMKIKDKPKMMHTFEKIVEYVLKNMGGFDIDGWKIRSPIKLSSKD